MTLVNAFGLYVGWDTTGPLVGISTYYGSIQAQVGWLLLGCDWFFKEDNARNQQAYLEGKNR